MKSKHWALLLGALLLLCGGLSLWLLLPGETASEIEILSGGEVLYTLRLDTDREVTVTSDRGVNTVTIQDGKVAVTHADCPDGYCMQRGWCASGVPIVCLPNQLQIRFLGEQALDGVSG